MTLATVRPIFQNGQRLTAERLMQAFEFLRTMVRRALLAPLSSGVAAGFDFTPNGNVVSSTLSISPGLAIDGKGRLIVVPTAQSFTAVEIAALAGIATPVDGTIVRICIALDDSSLDLDPCSPHRPLDIEEDYKLLFIPETFGEALFEIVNQFEEPNCVPPWENLDLPAPGGEDGCCVTLGHVIFLNATQFKTETTFFRQGVSPRFNVIRNTDGSPSIFLNEIKFTPTLPGAPSISEPGVGIPVTTLLGPKPVIVNGPGGFWALGPAGFANAGGLQLQATRVAPFLAPYSAGGMWEGDPRVFVFPGGAGTLTGTVSELPAGRAGVSAVPCELAPGSPDILRAGVPLEIAPEAGPSSVVRVRESTATTQELIGLSAGPSATLSGTRVVPVATAGLLKATLELGVAIGTPLTASSATPGALEPASSGEHVIARAAQSLAGAGDAYVWVVHPSVERP